MRARGGTEPTGGGFTLVELLVVVAILAMLMSLLLPAMNASVSTARRAVCQSNLHQTGVVLTGYAADNYGLFMPYAEEYLNSVWESSYAGPHQRDMLLAYAGTSAVFYCPAGSSPRPPSSRAFSSWVNTPGGGYRIEMCDYVRLGGLSGVSWVRYVVPATGLAYPAPMRLAAAGPGQTLTADYNVSWPGGGFGTATEAWGPSSNHMGRDGLVEGANSVMIDLHAEWHPRELIATILRVHSNPAYNEYSFW